MKALGRHTPTILNLGFSEGPFFWDGRAETLEDQALGPIASPAEMNLAHDVMEEKLRSIKGYQKMFEKAYPSEGISKDTVAKAIATFERTVVSGVAPFDRFVNGDNKAINEAAKRGFVLFNEKAKCATCHQGWRFTDDSFHDIGVNSEDKGRGDIIKEVDSLQFAFKTPTLRNIDRRAPYMHNGSEETLTQVIELYNIGGRIKRPSLSENIKPLGLTREEIADIVEFLTTLTSEDKPIEIPRLPM